MIIICNVNDLYMLSLFKITIFISYFCGEIHSVYDNLSQVWLICICCIYMSFTVDAQVAAVKVSIIASCLEVIKQLPLRRSCYLLLSEN